MSDANQNPPRGWYHADGDEPGTVRLWNGAEWVGFAQRDPSVASTAEPEPDVPAQGQVPLRGFAIAAQIGVGLAMLFSIFAIYVQIRDIGLVNDLQSGDVGADFAQRIEAVENLVTTALVITVVTVLGAGIAFVLWFFLAYRNMSLWHETRYGLGWSVFAWIVPFINLVRPGQIMLDLLLWSPRKQDEGALNPALAWGWWALFIISGVGGRAVARFDPESLETAVTLDWIQIALTVLQMASGVLAIMLIDQITDHQDRRFAAEKAARRAARAEAAAGAAG